jgi:SAM-dependent methyltransferase
MALVSPIPRVAGAVERLDAPGADPGVVAESLGDLARINRLFLGTRLTLASAGDLLGGAPPGAPVALLDAGCGGGDMALALARWARGRGFEARVVGIDPSPTIASLARRRVGEEVEVRVGDLLALDLADGSVDVAVCSLVLHHFEPEDAVRALRELRRVSRIGVVVNDLVRTPLGLLGAHGVARFLTRNPITRHDAVLSARRAYTRREVLGLLSSAELRPRRVRSALGYRVSIAAEAA